MGCPARPVHSKDLHWHQTEIELQSATRLARWKNPEGLHTLLKVRILAFNTISRMTRYLGRRGSRSERGPEEIQSQRPYNRRVHHSAGHPHCKRCPRLNAKALFPKSSRSRSRRPPIFIFTKVHTVLLEGRLQYCNLLEVSKQSPLIPHMLRSTCSPRRWSLQRTQG